MPDDERVQWDESGDMVGTDDEDDVEVVVEKSSEAWWRICSRAEVPRMGSSDRFRNRSITPWSNRSAWWPSRDSILLQKKKSELVS